MSDENLDVNGEPSTPEGGEIASEGVKTPQAEEPVPQPKNEEKTIPYSRFKEVNDELTKLKEQGGVKNTSLSPKKVWETSEDPLEVVKLGKALQDYSETETEFIIRNASEKNINGIVKATKDPMVEIAIKAMREKVAKEQIIPAPSSPSGTVNDSFGEDFMSASRGGSVQDVISKKVAELEAKEGKSEGI